VIFIDITELKRLQHKLEDLAYYDELTHILNRRAFFEQCEAYLDHMSHASTISIILFDIDYFKRINDSYGHYVGDRLLAHVAQVCREYLGEEAVFARYGGEEFVIALPGKSAPEGYALAEQLRSQLSMRPAQIAETSITVTSSFGVAEVAHATGETLHQLLHRADEALYQAKRGGRDRVCVSG